MNDKERNIRICIELKKLSVLETVLSRLETEYYQDVKGVINSLHKTDSKDYPSELEIWKSVLETEYGSTTSDVFELLQDLDADRNTHAQYAFIETITKEAFVWCQKPSEDSLSTRILKELKHRNLVRNAEPSNMSMFMSMQEILRIYSCIKDEDFYVEHRKIERVHEECHNYTSQDFPNTCSDLYNYCPICVADKLTVIPVGSKVKIIRNIYGSSMKRKTPIAPIGSLGTVVSFEEDYFVGYFHYRVSVENVNSSVVVGMEDLTTIKMYEDTKCPK